MYLLRKGWEMTGNNVAQSGSSVRAEDRSRHVELVAYHTGGPIGWHEPIILFLCRSRRVLRI